jgi:hypothetical protein
MLGLWTLHCGATPSPPLYCSVDNGDSSGTSVLLVMVALQSPLQLPLEERTRPLPHGHVLLLQRLRTEPLAVVCRGGLVKTRLLWLWLLWQEPHWLCLLWWESGENHTGAVMLWSYWLDSIATESLMSRIALATDGNDFHRSQPARYCWLLARTTLSCKMSTVDTMVLLIRTLGDSTGRGTYQVIL